MRIFISARYRQLVLLAKPTQALKRFSTLIALSLTILFSCSEGEEINITCADPLGADFKTLTHDNWACFLNDFNECFRFELDKTPPVIQSVYIPGHTYARIADLGKVKCLGEVKQKPSSGLAYAVPAVLQHGYVIQMSDGSYGRLFIDSWKVGNNGLVKEINITRQYAY